jgi:hypothetical protein
MGSTNFGLPGETWSEAQAAMISSFLIIAPI